MQMIEIYGMGWGEVPTVDCSKDRSLQPHWPESVCVIKHVHKLQIADAGR